jgi:hypothetical protein
VDIKIDDNIIYCDPYNKVQLWRGGEAVNGIEKLEKLENRNGYVHIEYDFENSQLWAISFDRYYKKIFFYKIIKNEVMFDEPILIRMDESVGFYTRIYNNKCLFELNDFKYEIIDLITNERMTFQIPRINGRLPMKYPVAPLNLYIDKIIFWNGYYSISENKYYYYNTELSIPRFIPMQNCLIGLNEMNYISIHRLKINKTEILPIQRKIKKYAKYNGSDLFYLVENNLYFSKDLSGIRTLFSLFLPIWYTQREWYKYNLDTHKTSKIVVPSRQVIILGDNKN